MNLPAVLTNMAAALSVERCAALKRFLRRLQRAKKIAAAALTLTLLHFEKYCTEELRQITSSIYPCVGKAIVTPKLKREIIIKMAMRDNKKRWLKEHRAGKRPAPFMFAMPFNELIDKWVYSMKVGDVATLLLYRRYVSVSRVSALSLDATSSMELMTRSMGAVCGSQCSATARPLPRTSSLTAVTAAGRPWSHAATVWPARQ